MTNQSENSTGPISKKQLLAELQSEQAAWLALLDEIGEENMTQPEVAGGWSIKDIVAHITGWRRRTVNRFRAALDPSTDMIALWPAELHEDDEVDEINAWIYKVNRDRPLADVLNDSHEVFQQLVAAVDALSDEQLNDPQRLPWFEGERLTGAFLFGHFHEEHEPDMRAWGPSSSATSTKSTSPTCERGGLGSSRQDKRGSNYLRTNRQPTSEKAIFQRKVSLSMSILDQDPGYVLLH